METGSETGRETVVAILQCDRTVKEADRLRIREWLKVRLGVEEVEVIVNTGKR